MSRNLIYVPFTCISTSYWCKTKTAIKLTKPMSKKKNQKVYSPIIMIGEFISQNAIDCKTKIKFNFSSKWKV